jgi:hypothetical protein
MIIKDEIQFKVEVKVAPSYVTDNGGKVGGKVGGKASVTSDRIEIS